MAAVTICSDLGAQKNKVWHCFHCFPIYLPWSDGTRCHDQVFWMLSFKPVFHSPLSLSSRGSLVLLHFLPRRVVSSAYLRLLIFLLAILIPTCASSSPAFLMMYSAYKLDKQGDNIQPWHTPFPIWNKSVVPWQANCCFLICIQVSQKRGQVVWYSHLFKKCSQFFVIHIVKGFGIVNKAEVDFFRNSLAFLMIQWMFAILSLVPLPFLNPALNIWKFWFMYCWRLTWRMLNSTLLANEMSAIVW